VDIVVIPFHDWKKCESEGFRTRDAHFMEEFGKHQDVETMIVINRPISISEMLIRQRSSRIKKGKLVLKESNISLTKINDKIFIVDIFVAEIFKPILMHRNWIPYIFGTDKFFNAIKMVFDRLEISQYSIISFSPLFFPLINKLNPSFFIFDALDNLLKHPDYKDIKNLSQYYQLCQEKADRIFTNSVQNQRWLSKKHLKVETIFNGVDTEKFNVEKKYSIPDDMKAIKKPVVGYAGKMQEMVNIELMNKIAVEFTHVSFVFIGQQLNPSWVESLWKHDNVFYLGDKKYETLPSYLFSFDICFIPYNVDRQHGGDPIKFYEYIAMEKPVVTSSIGGVGEYKDFPQVCVANDDEEFINGLGYFINKIEKGESIHKEKLPENCFWKTKADRIISSINQKNKF